MSKKPNTQDFLRAMQGTMPESEVGAPAAVPAGPSSSPLPGAAVAPVPLPVAAAPRPAKGRAKVAKPPRGELTHFGGYLAVETFEKIDLLKRRLKLDNSALIKLAIEDLYRKHSAKRAFGDA